MKIKQRTLQNSDHLALYDLLKYIEECVLEGYTVPDINASELFPRRFGPGQYFVAMVKEDDKEENEYRPSVNPYVHYSVEQKLEVVENMSGKKELMEFIEVNHFPIEYPANAVPKAIKQKILNYLNGKEED